MREWFIYGTYSVGVTGMLIFGLLMLLAPQKTIKLRDWMMRAERWSRPNPEWKPGYYLDMRFAGLALTVMAVLMIRPLLRAFLGLPSGHPRVPPQPGTPTTNIGPDWFALGIATVTVAGGIFCLVRPEAVARWCTQRLAHRIFDESALRKGIVGVRIMGGMAILAATWAIWAWLKSMG